MLRRVGHPNNSTRLPASQKGVSSSRFLLEVYKGRALGYPPVPLKAQGWRALQRREKKRTQMFAAQAGERWGGESGQWKPRIPGGFTPLGEKTGT